MWHVADSDIRPFGVLETAARERAYWRMGGVWATVVHVGIPVTAALLLFAARAVGVKPLGDNNEIRPTIPDVVQARFVQLGRPPDPNQLPNRRVPILPTAPLDPRSAPSLSDTPHTPQPRPETPRQREAAEDLNTVLARAQAFAERQQQQEQEGDPNGIEEGTEQQGNEGDIYEGRLYSFFKRGWSMPVTIDPDEASALRATAVVEIGGDANVVAFRLVRESDNPLFDQSIRDHLQRFVDNHEAVPPPPEELAAQYLGHEIQVNFSGRRR